tara:strand:+ start:1878 stop:2147 length:270 start_codon:yes stop_codon:yes gene_type:complete
VIDSDKKEVIVKVVNAAKKSQNIQVNLKGGKVKSKGDLIVLSSEKLEDLNSFDEPNKISPKELEIYSKKGIVSVTLDPYSFSILKFKMN